MTAMGDNKVMGGHPKYWRLGEIMKMLNDLPDNWRDQIQEAHNDLYVRTGVSPEIINLPQSWFAKFRVQVDAFIRHDDTEMWKYRGFKVAFGLVEKPICSILMQPIESPTLDIHNIAKRMGAKVKGKVRAKGGYFNALGLLGK